MNLTGQRVYEKGLTSSRCNKPTASDRKYWSQVVALGCIVNGCGAQPSIHHAETGGGGRKNHRRVLPLCHFHHQGARGIHKLSRKIWEPIYGSEKQLLKLVEKLLEEAPPENKAFDLTGWITKRWHLDDGLPAE